ncbi:MAG: response regulator [Chloroflexota bacterium]|jgi:two-component system, NtrC family, sensor kinase
MYERVLIVDDSEEIRDFLSEYVLKPKGFEVLTAPNGLMGLEMAIAKEPDLMIVDQQMPRLTGLEVLQKLHERDLAIPAILMTAHGSEDTAVAAFRLGIRDYIVKPIDIDEISDSVDRALRENRLQRERDQLVQQLMESNSQLQRRAQELNVLYGVGKSVSSSLDLEEVLHRVVEAAVYVVGAEEGSLMLLDEERNELYIRASKNLDSKAKSMRKRVTDSLAGKVLQTKRAIAIGSDSQWKRTHTALLVKSLIYIPLILQNKPIGVLGVANRVKEVSFDSNDTRALSALGSYATIAINNANIFRENQLERNMLSAVMDEMDEPLLVIDHQNRFLTLNDAARQVLNIAEKNVTGKPVTDHIENENLLSFILQKDEEALQTQTEVAGQNGRSYQVNLKLISGGGRSIRLQPL